MRILLVDDHLDMLRATAKYLNLKGHAVTTARTAAQAERLCGQGRVDLMISDTLLPDRCGWILGDVAKRCGVPAISLSALDTPGDIARSAAAGFALHLTKPVNFKLLDQALEKFALPHLVDKPPP